MEKSMKVSEWLSKCASSHVIHDHKAMASDFLDATGEAAPWPVHTVAACREAIKDRGLGGNINGPDDDKVCYGYEIAEALAYRFGGAFTTTLNGRGSIFRQCLAAIEAAEKRAE